MAHETHGDGVPTIYMIVSMLLNPELAHIYLSAPFLHSSSLAFHQGSWIFFCVNLDMISIKKSSDFVIFILILFQF